MDGVGQSLFHLHSITGNQASGLVVTLSNGLSPFPVGFFPSSLVGL